MGRLIELSKRLMRRAARAGPWGGCVIPSPLPGNLATGILHLGLGAFHRAHQAAFTQDAIAAAGGDWGIEAVSMRNPALAAALNAADGRFTLIERHPEGPLLREITVIRRGLALPGHSGAVARRIAAPDIRIVTNTVTEKGYGADLATRGLDRGAASVAHDLAQHDAPQSLPGLLCLGLSLRRAAGQGGLTVMSCDNLAENGRLLRAVVLEFARATDPGLADWIANTCAFPNSMVDRITPAATDATRALAQRALGRADPLAVETEPFRQWVIEDAFAGPRPAWERAGALIVADVTPFETMKLRMLNGAHSLIAYLGALAGLPAVRDVMTHRDLGALVLRHMRCAAETLAPLDGYDPGAYADALIRRFANPAIDHRCLQIAADGSQKLPQRIFAPARLLLDRGRTAGTFALAAAAWIRFAEGRDDSGAALTLNDPAAGQIRAALQAASPRAEDRVAAIAGLRGISHHGALDNAAFRKTVARDLDRLTRDGAIAGARSVLLAIGSESG